MEQVHNPIQLIILMVKRIRGLGMMFIYRIIKAYEGTIQLENRVESDYTTGTRITFTIRDYQ